MVRVSSIYDTDPVGFPEQESFLNGVAEVDWEGEPRELLRQCLAVEMGMGRERRVRNGPRTLDIDVLLCGNRIHREAGLEIPEAEREEYLDARRLDNRDGTGFLPRLLSAEDEVLARTAAFLKAPRGPEELGAFQDEMAAAALRALRSIQP